MEKICKNCAHWCICKTWATENGVCAMHDDRKSEGKWLHDTNWDTFYCSICDESALNDCYEHQSLSGYCPNCGAKMKGDTP